MEWRRMANRRVALLHLFVFYKNYFWRMLLSLRITKSTVRWKLFSRETAVSCSMCKKLCPLACKANTQHSQQHVCVLMYVCMLAAVFFFFFPYTFLCVSVCGRMEGHCHHYLSNTSLLGKRERRGGATQSCCRKRTSKDKKKTALR